MIESEFEPKEQKRLHDMFMRLSTHSGAADTEKIMALAQIEGILGKRGLTFETLAEHPEWIIGAAAGQVDIIMKQLDEAIAANGAYAAQNEAILRENESLRGDKARQQARHEAEIKKLRHEFAERMAEGVDEGKYQERDNLFLKMEIMELQRSLKREISANSINGVAGLVTGALLGGILIYGLIGGGARHDSASGVSNNEREAVTAPASADGAKPVQPVKPAPSAPKQEPYYN